MFTCLSILIRRWKALASARSELLPAGLLVLETPDIKSWPSMIFGARIVSLDAPRHLVFFSSKTLQKTVGRVGFQIINLKYFSPSTMEYSESLRYFLRDIGVERGGGRKNVMTLTIGKDNPQ